MMQTIFMTTWNSYKMQIMVWTWYKPTWNKVYVALPNFTFTLLYSWNGRPWQMPVRGQQDDVEWAQYYLQGYLFSVKGAT